jgi:peptidoglycan hydrolase-like protein with peptidoglycan-binding domain
MLLGMGWAPAQAVSTPQCNHAAQVLPDGPSGGVWAPVSAGGTSYCWMVKGDNSSGVWALQRALRFCYRQNIAVDSDFGPQTKAALQRVQGSLHIGTDGGYGPQTRGAMIFSSINSDAASACAGLSGVS